MAYTIIPPQNPGTGTVSPGDLTGFGNTRIPFGNAAGALTDSADLTYVDATNDLSLSVSESGGAVGSTVANASNTASSEARLMAQVAGSSAGDPSLRLSISGVVDWDILVANATSDELQIKAGATTAARATTAGRWGFGGAPDSFWVQNITGIASADGLKIECTARAYLDFYGSSGGRMQFNAFNATATRLGQTPATGFVSIECHAGETFLIGLDHAGSVDMITNNVSRVKTDGNRTLVTNRLNQTKGADVASGGTVTFGVDGDSFDITGTTNIDFATTTNWSAGARVVMQFDGILTVNHNTGSPPANTAPILLAGAVPYVTTAGDTLTVWYDGAAWREVGRSVI